MLLSWILLLVMSRSVALQFRLEVDSLAGTLPVDPAWFQGRKGGPMTVCSSLQDGLGMHARYAKALLALTRYVDAKSSLDFGSGLGLYSTYLGTQLSTLTDLCC